MVGVVGKLPVTLEEGNVTGEGGASNKLRTAMEVM